MWISRRLLLLFALLPLALFVAGCGGGGGDDSTAAAPVETTEETTALSKAELISQGDAICAEVNAAVGTVGSTSTDAAGQAAQVAGLYGGMVERLKGLGAPSDDSAGYADFIASAEALAQAEDDVQLAAEREEETEEAEAEASTALSAFESAAGDFGFEECSQAPAAPTPSSTAPAGGEEAAEGGEEEAAEAAPEEEAEAAPEEAPPVEEESAGGGAGVGGGAGGGGSVEAGGTSGGVGPG